MTDALDHFDEPTPPTGLSAFLYPRPAERSVTGILRWWESRRLPFNLVVGASGLVTLGVAWLVATLPPYAYGFQFALLPIVAYGVAANVCFTLGSVTEIVLEKLFGRDLLPTGPTLWRMGLTFSLGLTVGLPVLLLILTYVARVVFGG